MLRRLPPFLLVLALALWRAGAACAALAVVDDTGRELRLDAPARRVISLSPHLTELVYAIGAGDRMAATVRGSDYPAQAAGLPQVGDAAGLDFERILAARPDLVLAWHSGNRAVDVARLRALGLAVLELEPRQPADIARHLRLLGRLLDSGPGAQAAAQAFEARLAGLRGRYAGRSPVGVVFEIWHQPLFTVNGEHIISAVLRLCGGRNLFASAPQLAMEVSTEQVLMLDPDVIVVGSEAPDAGAGNWSAYPWMKAVRGGNVFTVSADLVTRQTPRMADAAQSLCEGLDRARRQGP
ncbi:MAG TPA: cobalamin-binding protein [Burkholderiales bacterium]|nr:cobalamin-binding protein [Burkholderiales bacterium]